MEKAAVLIDFSGEPRLEDQIQEALDDLRRIAGAFKPRVLLFLDQVIGCHGGFGSAVYEAAN